MNKPPKVLYHFTLKSKDSTKGEQTNHLHSQPPEVWDRAYENMRGYFKAAKEKVEVQK